MKNIFGKNYLFVIWIISICSWINPTHGATNDASHDAPHDAPHGATHSEGTADQGEEVYEPTKNLKTPQKTTTESQTKTYPKVTNHEKEVTSEKEAPQEGSGLPLDQKTEPVKENIKTEAKPIKLKEFNAKKPAPLKNGLPTDAKPEEHHADAVNEPVVNKQLEEKPISAQDDEHNVKPHADAIPETENKIQANKLVEPDENTDTSPKYNGILWFLGVFVTLLIVIFAFT